MASSWFESDEDAHSGSPERHTADDGAVGSTFTEVIPHDDPMWPWLARCRQLAESALEGIETPADELMQLAAGDREMMERARRQLLDALGHEPRNPTLRQMLALWRRAFEKGDWSWQENPWDHNPLIS